ncbi:MAG: peptidoglycan editing factor PgeF [Alphaproteobacteria bacterium]|jgi:YfiH family protein|nr:peptidoglycan editing factor PgeF [Alphaproteobacteria bacterium]
MKRSALLAERGVAHGFGDRRDGVSVGVYARANAGFGGDEPAAVRENRRRFARTIGADPAALCSLRQVHGRTARIVAAPEQAVREGDALVSRTPGLLLAVTTADCVPVLALDPDAGVAAAVHAGWRGAVAGVVAAAVEAMAALGAEPARVTAAIGPCIRQESYEVDAPVRDAVVAAMPNAAARFAPGLCGDRWQFDLAGHVAALLRAAGAFRIDDLALDTLQNDTTYFSHRGSKQRNEVGYGVQLAAIRVPG